MENNNIFAELLRSLEERAHAIVVQNRALLTRLESLGFNPVKELDFTANNAGVLIHRLFEAIARFDEGKVPFSVLAELCSTTDTLIDELKKRDDAPVCELDAAGVAFREAGMLWNDNHPEPLMEREVYLKKHFDGEKDIKKALKTLHAAYVKKYAAKGRKRKTLSAADSLKENNKENEKRTRIYQEIDRLRKNGYSITKAIELMRNGTYGSRMRDVSVSTWRRYYLERCRRNRLADAAKALGRDRVNETVNEPKNETVKTYFHETVNINSGSSEGGYNQQELVISETKNQDSVAVKKSENETVKSKIRETVKIKNETVNETVKVSSKVVKSLVKRYPGVNSRRLAELIGKSRATIMRFISELKSKGEIVFKGSAKSGGYFLA